MKPNRLFLLIAGVLILIAAPAEARGRRGDSSSPERGGSKGLQLASGLQMSGPLNGSGPAPVAERLSDHGWQKLFPRKVAAK